MKKFVVFLFCLFILNASCASTSPAQKDGPPYPTPVVILYSAAGCWWCEESTKFLEDNEVDYIERDLEDPEEFKKLQKIAKKLNYKGGLQVVPIFVVGRYIIRGFDPVAVMYALEKSKWIEPRWDSFF
tara:strand:- start:81 stop:464 length:384 start_codon:yes stop_codon:yes gene_type:complete